jgi:hypothetical protein
MKQDRKDFTSGVVGVGVSKQGSFEDPSMDILDDVDDVGVFICLFFIKILLVMCLLVERISFELFEELVEQGYLKCKK